MAWLTALTLLAVVLSVSSTQRYTDDNIDNGESVELQQKYKVIVNEVEDLRKTVKILKDDMKRMKRISRALDALCEELQSGEEKHSGEQNQNVLEPAETNVLRPTAIHGADTQDAVLTPIRALVVETNNNTFNVHYESTSKPRALEMDYSNNETNYHHGLDNMYSNGEGWVNGTVPSRDFGVHLTLGRYASSVYLAVDNDTEVTLPPLELVADVQDEIVFYPGQSVDIKVNTSKKNWGYFQIHFAYFLILVNRNETENVITSSSVPGIINMTEKKETSDHNEYSFTINENKENSEGVVVFQVYAITNQPSMVSYLALSLYLNVRRSDHTKPFLTGVLVFVSYREEERNMSCEEGTVCSLFVSIVGKEPDGISLWRLRGEQRQKLTVPTMKYEAENILSVQFRIKNIQVSDSGRYLYQGVSKSGIVIEQEIELSVSSIQDV